MNKSIYLLLFLIWACGSSESRKETALNLEVQVGKIILVDTFQNELILDTANCISEAFFRPMYIGKIKDSIALKYNSRKIKQRTLEWGYPGLDSFDLTILVDTTRTIASSIDFFLPPPSFPDRAPRKSEKTILKENSKFKSYPVIMRNSSMDTLQIGIGEHLPMIMEAVDSLGEWKAIQRPFMYGCGTGLTCFKHPPGEIIITSCKLYQGDYRTKMRLVFIANKRTYSNEFYANMNYQQFDKPKNRYY